jgi:GNAT superfamily N-acetyltransferase
VIIVGGRPGSAPPPCEGQDRRVDPLLARIDAFCDAVPRRHATTVDVGPLRLFVRDGPGAPLYARPIPGAGPVGVTDVERMRHQQRALGAVEAFEWLHAAAPAMEGAARAAELDVQVCPVLALDGDPVPSPFPADVDVHLLDPDDRDLAVLLAGVSEAGALAFGVPVPPPPDLAAVAAAVADLEAGTSVRLLVTGPDGPVAAGQAQRVDGVAELVGIGTVDGQRGRGLAAAVTARLAAEVRSRGDDLVFLAAGDDAAARVYERVGFRPAGTCGLAARPE